MSVKRIRVYKSTGRSPDYISYGSRRTTHGPGELPSQPIQNPELEQEIIARAIAKAKSNSVR